MFAFRITASSTTACVSSAWTRPAGRLVSRPDRRDDPCPRETVQQGHAVALTLPDRFVVQDRAADAIAHLGRRHDLLAVGSPRRLGFGNAQGCKAFVAGAVALIHGEQAAALANQSLRLRRQHRLAHAGRAPHPVAYLGQVLAVLVDVVFVLDQLIPHLLLQVRAPGAQVGQAVDHVLHQVEPVQLVPAPGCRRRS